MIDPLHDMPCWDLDDGPDWDAEFDWMVDNELRLSIEEHFAPALALYPIPVSEDRIVREYEPLVRRLAARFRLDDDDGLQVARIGLLKSTRRFDPRISLAFDQYRGVWCALRDEERRREVLARQAAAQLPAAEESAGIGLDTVLYGRQLLAVLEARDPRASSIVKAMLEGERRDVIARQHSVSCERVRQIAQTAVTKLHRRAEFGAVP